MWVVLVPSGVVWLDAEIGGFPASGVVAAIGAAGAGKTSLALGFAASALTRGRTCFLTSESADAVIETCRTMLEHDLRPNIAEGRLTILSFAPFFTNKVRSLNSVDAPFAELKDFFAERQIKHVVFDTIDPLLTWIDAASATAVVRGIMGQMQSWGISVLCMLGGSAPAIAEFARTASGSIEINDGKLVVHHAGWCNVYGIEAPLQFVQGRGFVVRGPASHRAPARAASSPTAHQPEQPKQRAPVAIMGLPYAPPAPAAFVYTPPEVDPTWQSLIGNEGNPRAEVSLIGQPPGMPSRPPQRQIGPPVQEMQAKMQAKMQRPMDPSDANTLVRSDDPPSSATVVMDRSPAPPPKRQR